MILSNDKRFYIIAAAFLLLLGALVLYHSYANLIMLGALLIFGATSLTWKEPGIRLESVALLVLLALANVYVNGIKFGIDFAGGTRIPVVLDQPVDAATMSEMVNTIKTRANVLGLTEVRVRAIGDNQINVEVPGNDESTITFIEQTIAHQGVYQGIVDGKVAVSGEHIFSTSIRSLDSAQLTQSRADWGVAFSVDQQGALQFAEVAKGKADYPVYMFLDRPKDAVIFYTSSQIKNMTRPDSSQKETIKSIQDSLKLQGDDIAVYITDNIFSNNLNESANLTAKTNKTKALVSSNLPSEIKNKIKAAGFFLVEFNESEITPEFGRSRGGALIIDKLPAVGLLSAPLLSADTASGVPSYGYTVTGSVPANTPSQIKVQIAAESAKSTISILKGGSLPVQISLGSRTSLPASLGQEFLKLSLIGIVASLILISLFIGLRYRNVTATLPIVVISLAELIILVSVLGSFTIDLGAMAGIIAAIGVGVDAQIVITDELLKKDDQHTNEEKAALAFGIIKTNAVVAIFSMVPLIFSQIVEVIGFATSTILGALLGYMITRPAYAAILETIIEKVQKKN
ncbi:hypothetical protein HY988_05425 [Candidatus Micrarchaeota archaeon]|nr:hypothetical protein [Candidatus Micrarchaeota archaeon]